MYYTISKSKIKAMSKKTNNQLHGPCEPYELVDNAHTYSADDILHELILDEDEIEGARREILERSIDGSSISDLPKREMKGIEKLVETSAVAAVAAGELILCETCKVQDCELKSTLEDKVELGKKPNQRLDQRLAEKSARVRFMATYAAENRPGGGEHKDIKDIEIAQESQHVFASLIADQSSDPAIRDDMISNIYRRLGRQELKNAFYPFVLGAICETVTLEQAEKFTDRHQQLSIEASTAHEDIREGTDFFIAAETNSGNKYRVRVDVKSSSQFIKMTEDRNNKVKRFKDDPYTAIVKRPGYEPVLLLNPEGDQEKNALVQHSNDNTGGRTFPSYEINTANEEPFEKAMAHGVMAMIKLGAQNKKRTAPAKNLDKQLVA